MKPKAYIEDGQAKGILVEMMQYVGKDIDCQFNFKFSTWARAYKNMLSGDGGVIGLSKTKSREQLIDYTDVMYIEDVLLVTHINNPLNYTNINDLAGKTVITSRAVNLSDEFEYAIENNVFTFITDNGDIAKRLERVARGRVDVAIISPGKYAYNNAFINNPSLSAIKDQLYVVPALFLKDPNYLGFSKKNNHDEFIKAFNASMQKGKKSGLFKIIEDKYHLQYQ